ncbi:3-oxoadipate CoA-transferase subunit B [compost metagenome]
MSKELTVVSIHDGVTREQIVDNCGWPIKFADQVIETPVPTEIELATLRDINARTRKAHQGNREAA